MDIADCIHDLLMTASFESMILFIQMFQNDLKVGEKWCLYFEELNWRKFNINYKHLTHNCDSVFNIIVTLLCWYKCKNHRNIDSMSIYWLFGVMNFVIQWNKFISSNQIIEKYHVYGKVFCENLICTTNQKKPIQSGAWKHRYRCIFIQHINLNSFIF